jgi:spermidine/putrescine transport system substrate-binding protein
MKRVSLLWLVAALVAATAAACAGASPSPTMPPEEEPRAGPLHLLNWQGYGSDEPWAHEMFNEKYGVEIVHDYYNSNEELLTKLRTSPGTYDAVLIGNTWGATAIDEGLLEPIQVDALEHYGDLSDQLVNLPDMRDDGTVYGVPWDWGATGMAYNQEQIGEEIDSMDAFWESEYAGKIAWQDYYIDNIMFAAIALGQDPNNPSDLEAVKQKLIDLMPQLKTFWASEDEFNKRSGHEDGAAAQVRRSRGGRHRVGR